MSILDQKNINPVLLINSITDFSNFNFNFNNELDLISASQSQNEINEAFMTEFRSKSYSFEKYKHKGKK